MSSSTVLWRPSPESIENSRMEALRRTLQKAHPEKDIRDYEALHRFSVQHSDLFWPALLEFLEIKHTGSVVPTWDGHEMPAVRAFPNITLNYAENLLAPAERTPGKTALTAISESRAPIRLTYGELKMKVARFAQRLRQLGIKKGDRVAGILPNGPEAVIAMLATSSIGALWSSCSPDFGVQGILDRFGQIEPTLLLGVDAYRYAGKEHDCKKRLSHIAQTIASIEHLVLIPYLNPESSTDDFGAGSATKRWLWEDFL